MFDRQNRMISTMGSGHYPNAAVALSSGMTAQGRVLRRLGDGRVTVEFAGGIVTGRPVACDSGPRGFWQTLFGRGERQTGL